MERVLVTGGASFIGSHLIGALISQGANVSVFDSLITGTQINVKTIAEIVVEKMGLRGIEFKFTGRVDGGRGWKGDVKNML